MGERRSMGERCTMRGPSMQVKFPYIRKYRDRHGKVRIEYRRDGRTIPIRATPGSHEFQAAYDAARIELERSSGKTSETAWSKGQSGSLGWLCLEYFKSIDFEQLALSTRRARRLVLEGILREPTRPGATVL